MKKKNPSSFYTVTSAKAHLSELLVRVSNGEDIVIARGGLPIAHLVRYQEPKGKRVPGALSGQLVIRSGFDHLPKDIAGAFGMSK